MLFNTEMVRAILEGRKTVTRRAVKPQPKGAQFVIDYDDEEHTADIMCRSNGDGGGFLEFAQAIKAPVWPGDILWVRETWCESLGQAGKYFYRAYAGPRDEMKEYAHSFNHWRPSIHMPREAARIFLRVTDVRVERLQEITAEGALDEGTDVKFPEPKPSYISLAYTEMRLKPAARQSFSKLWDSTIKPKDLPAYGWEANPWVWALEFERISEEEAERHG